MDNDFFSEDTRGHLSDVPKFSDVPVSGSDLLTDYDRGYFDGYASGITDGCIHPSTTSAFGDIPGGADDSHKEPAPLDAVTVPAAAITSRSIYGKRGPWGNVEPR